jgi:hypothetical protein
MPNKIQCDFCTSTQPAWVWRTRSFVMPNIGWASDGNWTACNECNTDILANNWVRLLERSAVTIPQWSRLDYASRILVKNAVMYLHKAFRQNLLLPTPEAI